MINIDFSSELKSFLLELLPDAKSASGGKEINCNCRICGEEKRHMYIGLGDVNTPPLYHCFKCGSSGIVNGQFLRAIEIYDTDFIRKLNSNVTNIINKPGNQIYKDSTKTYHLRTFNNKSSSSDYKLSYLNNRLGTTLTYEDANNLRIILDIREFINLNRITNLTRHINIVNFLGEFFIGFLSMDNAFITLRNLVPENANVYVPNGMEKRYVNYSIFNKINTNMNYYTIPVQPIDLCDPSKIRVNLAEGVFDILSIYFNIEKNPYRNIYMAIRGNNYLNPIKYIIEGLGMINIEIHIYTDNDVNPWYLKKISRYLIPFAISVYLHRNTFEGEKDFGVDISHINHVCEKLIY